MKKLLAFTLAEVLITLGIIGVVASITISTLVNEVSDSKYKTAYKKAFSQATNALNSAKGNNAELVPVTSQTDGTNACVNWIVFSSQFKKNKECISNNTSECWYYSSSSELSNGSPDTIAYAFVDSSGVVWSMRGRCSSTTANNSFFLIDTNGSEGPNKFGKDRWVLSFVFDNGNSGTPTKVSLYDIKDYIGTDTNAWACPTGPCYYKSWLLE